MPCMPLRPPLSGTKRLLSLRQSTHNRNVAPFSERTILAPLKGILAERIVPESKSLSISAPII